MTEKFVSEAWQVMCSTGHVSAGVGPENGLHLLRRPQRLMSNLVDRMLRQKTR